MRRSGNERIVGDVPLHDAPGRLARAVLQATPSRFLDLAPPFTMAVLDPADERLELFTDSIGVGRLFQLRLKAGVSTTQQSPPSSCAGVARQGG